jgi:hypothetical protein
MKIVLVVRVSQKIWTLFPVGFASSQALGVTPLHPVNLALFAGAA